MRLRYSFTLLATVAALAFATASALAAKPNPILLGTPPSETMSKLQLGAESATATCQLGTLPPPAFAFGYIIPPDDEYYQLIDPAQCAGCNGTVQLETAHIALYWTAACTIPVTVSIVPAINLGNGCLAPDVAAPPICLPLGFVVNNGGFLGQCVDVSFALPSGCCVSKPVFLKFRFDQGTCPNARPAFCGPASCSNCQQYNYYPGAAAPGDDLCAVLSPQGIYGINMWADASCCGATPSLPQSWGTIKTLYR